MQMLSPWPVKSDNQVYPYTSWSISLYVSEKLLVQLPECPLISRLTLHWCRDLRILEPPDHSSCTSPDSYHLFPWDWDPYSQRSTPLVPLWSTADKFSWDNLHWTNDLPIIYAMSGLEVGQYAYCSVIAMRTCEHWSLLPHMQLYSWSSQCSRWGSLLPMITLDLVMLLCELGSQLWHTGFMWGRKQALFLNLMEISFGSQDLKLPFLCPVSQVDVTSVHSPTELPWMRLVQAAANSKEQNLEAYLENSQLYYRSTRKINKNEELLVWYDEELSSLLGFNEIKAQSSRNGKYQIADCRSHWRLKCVCSFFSMRWSCNTGNKTCLYP